MSEPTATRPFAPFEWMLSLRYLRARRKEGFISIIAGFSFLGIMLGVATLIIVMAVMNGFRKELLDKILGLNGHLLVQPLESPLTDWDAVTPSAFPAFPACASRSRWSTDRRSRRRRFIPRAYSVRGIRGADLEKLDLDLEEPEAGHAGRLRRRAGHRHRPASRRCACRCAPATTSRWSRRAAR